MYIRWTFDTGRQSRPDDEFFVPVNNAVEKKTKFLVLLRPHNIRRERSRGTYTRFCNLPRDDLLRRYGFDETPDTRYDIYKPIYNVYYILLYTYMLYVFLFQRYTAIGISYFWCIVYVMTRVWR